MAPWLETCVWAAGRQEEAARALVRGENIDWLELEEEPLTCANVADQLRAAVPAVVVTEDRRVLSIEKVHGRHAVLLGPDGVCRRVPLRTLTESLAAPAATLHEQEIDVMLEECGIFGRARRRARRALIAERIADIPAGKAFQVRTDPGNSFAGQLRHTGLFRRVAAFAVGHLTDYALSLAAWIVIGQAALRGHVDSGGLLAWGLLLATLVPVRLWVAWSQGVLAIGAGGLLKQRLLAGALNLDSDALRAEGAGRMLGRTIEAEALESLALSGGLAALLSVLELAVTAVVLALGAGGWTHVLLLAAWVTVTLGLGWRYVLRRTRWTDTRLSMTNDLVERMTGHRTRLTQESPEDWHQGEDDALAEYANDSERMDRLAALLTAAAPRGWVLMAFAALLPVWLAGSAATGSVAIAIGGILLADQSLRRLTAGMAQLAGAGIAWRQVSPLFHAAKQRSIEMVSPPARTETVLEASDLVFRYRQHGAAVLNECSVKIRRGDFVLIEGGSGSGKSTLASVLTGLRKPESGMLLAGGLDMHSLGEQGWRGRIAAAPQYHENHVLSAPFAWNLLMGRNWPLGKADFDEAEVLCRELGLGPLLDRMPGGLMQMVGETGWQLSQGERSRLFLARALLQGGDLVILDESFAALDPDNLRHALECVLRRAETLLVVAHP